jgi:predicted lipoprotein with Yx(FWY)xxD motif
MTIRSRPVNLAAGALAALAAAAIAGCGSGGSSSQPSGYPAGGYGGGAAKTTAAAGTGAAIVGSAKGPLGTYLVDAKGRTVYLFEKDQGAASACSGACAAAWPPLLTKGAPAISGAAKAGDLGTTKRADGTTQITYKGHPLYTYAADARPGQTTGQGVNSFGAKWYVLAPSGSKIDAD